ncbi:MAG: pirin family protein [Myxococcota bacterium]|nr:pirin family protein [Myxococcota bacterium]
MTQKVSLCRVVKTLRGHQSKEGAGFPVRRPFPAGELQQVDPFLLLDEMGPVNWPPGEALGAPSHPHRGFETVTYLLEGAMEHRDSVGNVARIEAGGVQWMTAGRGVIHSELPTKAFKESGGAMHGFQLWLNLPQAQKMIAPRYQGVSAEHLPKWTSEAGDVVARVIAGKAMGLEAVAQTHTPITYLHLSFLGGAAHALPVDAGQNFYVYVFRGEVEVASETKVHGEGEFLVLGQGDCVGLKAGGGGAEVLILGATPIGESISRYGPFVMNTREEILQALQDYHAGTFLE